MRNEDQATIHKGLLRAVISKETIQCKIADMVSIRLRQPRMNHSRAVETKLGAPIVVREEESLSAPQNSSQEVTVPTTCSEKSNYRTSKLLKGHRDKSSSSRKESLDSSTKESHQILRF